ncbi:GNAT family N-acetyltransferase [Acinetobacter defluvii]|uniref:GNAT family N-acetyltransferase n=1 Tax=Acinetobacter defluvii TaxID=1871111 RepID=A0A2S2FAX4_9GAMM|nr:GNAT family N-acetyltransferase [Acinetobacter defluvii]AWL28127.1 GNAT family N-acetyltransferase [Acinetobacter defluvii]
MIYSIRPALVSDISLLIQIEQSANQAFAQIPKLKWLAKSSVMSSDEHLQLIQKHYAFVAVNVHDQALGFLYAEQQGNDLYIIELDVAAEYQQQGIGRQLMTYMIDFAKQQGFQAVTLATFTDVAWNRPFYEKLGFKRFNPQNLKPYLKQKIDHEVTQGFERESRCAMQFTLPSHKNIFENR